MTDFEILSRRALGRATLARQLLLERSPMPVLAAVDHLVGLQAQTPHTAYTGLWSRLDAFDPTELGQALTDRSVVRMALMRSTIHLVTARDAWGLRALLQPVSDRMFRGQFGRRLEGIDTGALVAAGRAFVDTEPRTFKQLGDHLLEQWPGRDRLALEIAIRTAVPLIQVPPRAVWGRSGPVAHTSIETWLGAPPADTLTIDEMVRRYLAAFGPASVMDAQAWCGLTRLREVFERLRPELAIFVDETGRELFDVPTAPRPPEDTPSPVRYLYDYDNVLLSHADRSRMLPTGPTRPVEMRDNEPVSAFLVDGVVAGIWRVKRDRQTARLTLSPTVAIDRSDRRALEAEGDRLLTFLTDGVGSRDVIIES
jgi:Winged helix DNA-binding domain